MYKDIVIDLDLVSEVKEDMRPSIKQDFLEHIDNHYKGYIQYYPDGSVMSEKAGYGICNRTWEFSERINNLSSIKLFC